ncbi:MAG: hypothetical protein Q8K59_02215 [Nitrosomonas sp.]|nr:hypothetical protein [Nitrosomonas sp.]MDP1949907.1 hypothetical protein [Nitrosomonas sp.]
MHSIVPIIMALGAIAFFTGLFVLGRFGMQQAKEVKILGKEYKLWLFTITTIGSGVFLIMLSVLIHQHVPYTPDTDQTQLHQAGKSDFELELILSGIKSDAMTSYLKQFQQEYQNASRNGDKSTTELLLLELQFRLRSELEEQGYDPVQIEKEVSRVMALLQPKPKK